MNRNLVIGLLFLFGGTFLFAQTTELPRKTAKQNADQSAPKAGLFEPFSAEGVFSFVEGQGGNGDSLFFTAKDETRYPIIPNEKINELINMDNLETREYRIQAERVWQNEEYRIRLKSFEEKKANASDTPQMTSSSASEPVVMEKPQKKTPKKKK